MPYIYPPAAPTLSGDTLSASRFLQAPTLVSRRLRTLLEQRFIGARLLTQRFTATGGAIVFETGETIYANDDPKAVAPLADYPLASTSTGVASVAKTVKFGEDEPISDEAITRLNMQPVERSMVKLANSAVKTNDAVIMAALASAVTATAAAGTAWATAAADSILNDAMTARANVLALNMGYHPDVVVLDDLTWTKAFIAFVKAGFLPREAENPIASGSFPVIGGMTWLPTPNVPVAGRVLVADSTMLGGIAREQIESPGYQSVNADLGIESKTIRTDDNDGWRIRVRYSNVPVILEPASARWITGV